MRRGGLRRRRASEPKRGGIHSLSDSLQSYLTASGLGDQLASWPVFDAWSRAAGERMGERARPVRFDSGILVVEVDSAAHLHELEAFTGEALRLQANKSLKEAATRLAIHRVQFRLKS